MTVAALRALSEFLQATIRDNVITHCATARSPLDTKTKRP